MASIDPALSAGSTDTNPSQQPLPSMNQTPGPMPTLQPQHPEQYRAMLPPPNQMYAPQGYAPQPPMPYPQQPAPRQRTAIACKYCRRRKIRCSGFDQNEEGKCTNCQRFGIECLFAPVSASSHAFVPAHALYGRGQPPPNSQLYGAFGQPLPQQYDQRGGYPPQQPGQYPPPPQGYQQPGMYPQPPQPGTSQGPGSDGGRKRANDEPHTPSLPPPQRDGYGYPDPSGLTPAGASPASSHSSFHSATPAQPYYAQQMSAGRASSSPNNHGFMNSTVPPPTLMPAHDERQPMAHANVRGHGQAATAYDTAGPAMQQYTTQQAAAMTLDGRTSTDSSMVHALRRGPM
nr:hypothetical protein CFP56_24630 [Quercus suber]